MARGHANECVWCFLLVYGAVLQEKLLRNLSRVCDSYSEWTASSRERTYIVYTCTLKFMR